LQYVSFVYTNLGLIWTHLTIETRALLLAFENGSKLPPSESCNTLAMASLIHTLAAITSTVEPFTLGTRSIDFNLLSPFVPFSVYKAAAIITERILTGIGVTEGLRQLRILREFLKTVGTRWLAGGKLLSCLRVGWAD